MFLATVPALLLTVAAAALAYAALVALLRLGGKRTLAKWNAFDLVVTVALGSSLATVVLSGSTPAAQGIVAFVALVALQFAVSWLAVRSRAVERVVKSEPVFLLRDGLPQARAMRRERVTEAELRAAIRSRGIGCVGDVAAVVLETDGSISVIAGLGGREPTALADVKSLEPRP